MTPPRLFLDIHLLHSVPPSTLNRDGLNTPKTATYGGVRRGVVSSQCWKRATRIRFNENPGLHNVGTRTKRLEAALVNNLRSLSPWSPEDAGRIAHAALVSGLEMSMADDNTSALFFYSTDQLDALAATINKEAAELRDLDDKNLAAAMKDLRPRLIDALGQRHSLDIALFGRMVANRSELRVNGSCSVAQALSTHHIDIEQDWFTAVDDLSENPGAAHLDTTLFTSSTYYRYAAISVHELARNLGGDAAAAAAGADLFLDSFVRSMPTGKQTSSAAYTLPSVVVVTLRNDRAVSFVGAFEKPVRATTRSGYVDESALRLAQHVISTNEMWGDRPDVVAAAYTVSDPVAETMRNAFDRPLPFDQIRAVVRDELNARIPAAAPSS